MNSLTVDKTFSDALDRLQAGARSAGHHLVFDGCVLWMKLGTDDKILDGFNHDEIADTFSRNGTSKAYLETLTGEQNSFRVAQAAKVQGDVLSAFERDLRMRSRSRMRMMAHAASRMASHGVAAGPIQSNLLQFVRLLIDSGPAEV